MNLTIELIAGCLECAAIIGESCVDADGHKTSPHDVRVRMAGRKGETHPEPTSRKESASVEVVVKSARPVECTAEDYGRG